MNIIIVLFQVFLCLALLIVAVIVTFRPRMFKQMESFIPSSRIARIVQATFLWMALIANLAGISVPFLVFFASFIAFVTTIPLVLRTVYLKVTKLWALPVAIIVLSVIVGIVNPLGLKVIALPKADELPLNLCSARIIKTYDEGFWFEGIASGEDGTLYLSGNRGEDFSRIDYYRNTVGELIERKPDGSEHILFNTPKGHTSGMPLLATDNSIYLASHGDESCIWRITKNNKPVQLVRFPKGAWPNGLDEGPDGMLYAADSKLGIIWRINPKSGSFKEAIHDPALLARPFISLAPGANGLHFRGYELIVTVSDRTTVLKYPIEENGKFGQSSVIARGIPGDDFTIGKDGSLFVTTHPYNTIVKISPGGERTIIGKVEQHIIGATDAVFGKTPQDQNTLYVVTDGGAFTGGAKTRGELVALEPYSVK